jgi:predicted anti-sigma-YlaC factor YlaD
MTGGRSLGASTATPFPEELLSGYLDGALTQQEEQRVRLHLERTPEARAMLEQLAALRQAARSTPFAPVEDRQWSEKPRTRRTAIVLWLGVGLLTLCGLGLAFLLVWQASHAPLGTEMKRGMIWWSAGLWLSGLGGAVLVFLSILGDRLIDRRSDRYRRVLK